MTSTASPARTGLIAPHGGSLVDLRAELAVLVMAGGMRDRSMAAILPERGGHPRPSHKKRGPEAPPCRQNADQAQTFSRRPYT